MKRGTQKDTACPYIFFDIKYYIPQNCTYISWSVSRKIENTAVLQNEPIFDKRLFKRHSKNMYQIENNWT